MANYNKVILVGNLTRDPQLSYLPSQTPVVEFGLAINRQWRGQDGQQRDETCFIDCRTYGKQAEIINQYLKKGRPVLIEGRLEFDTWEGKDGQRRSKHRVYVEQFQFLDSGQRAPAGGAPAPYPSQARPQPAAPPAPARPQPQQPPPRAEPPSQEAPPPDIDEPPPSAYDDDFGGGEDIPF